MTLGERYRRWREECHAEGMRHSFWARMEIWKILLILAICGSFEYYARAEVLKGRLTVTGWMKTGDNEWKSYFTDAQVSVVTLSVEGKGVQVKVMQHCFDQLGRTLEQKKTLAWRFGERHGVIIGCHECSLSPMPQHLEVVVLRSDLPPEIAERLARFKNMKWT